MNQGYQPNTSGGKKPKPPPRDTRKTAAQLAELVPRADTVTTLSKAEAQRVLAWFGQAASVAPGDFELAARIRRAFE